MFLHFFATIIDLLIIQSTDNLPVAARLPWIRADRRRPILLRRRL